MSHHNIEDFKPLSVSPNFGVLARPSSEQNAEAQTRSRNTKLSLGAPTSVGPPTEFEPPARLGEAPARQAVLKRHTQARAHARDSFRPPPGAHFCRRPASTTDHHTWPERSRSRL